MNSQRLLAAFILTTMSCGGDNGTEPMPTPSERIAAARAAPDGPTTLPIDSARVTFVKPLIGGDPAGFFIQAGSIGPALFIAVDPASVSPVPVVGDKVSFTISAMGTTAGLRQATAISISGFTRISQGNSITGLVQDVSTRADLVSSVTSYESELIHLVGTTTTDFGAAGAGYSAGGLSTIGLPADPSLDLRLPTALATSLDLTSGCAVTVDLVPMWRNGATAQVSAWSGSDIQVTSCPAPRVAGAEASSSTSVQVHFDRLIEAGSVSANGSQFSVPGLTVSAASVSGKTVTLTTSAQTNGNSYTVTVAVTVTDTRGTGLNPAARSATFSGF